MEQGEGQNRKFYLSSHRNLKGDPAKAQESEISKEDLAKLDNMDEGSFLSTAAFRKPFSIYASCEDRLTVTSHHGLTNYNSPATDIINLLHRSPLVFEEIRKAIRTRFGYSLVLLNHMGIGLELGVAVDDPPIFSDSESKTKVYKEIEDWKSSSFTTIQEAGHGLRAMFRILETLLNETSYIKLIDEPEMHLYPAQKIWLGGMIASHSQRDENQTIVVTHDTHLLQGILDKRPEAKVLRFAKENGERVIFEWELKRKAFVASNTLRADFLSGLFHDYIIAVEGETDRLFYQEMQSDTVKLKDLDVAFVPCRGEGAAINVVELSKAMNQKIAVVFDLDVVFEKPEVIKRIVSLTVGQRDLPCLSKFMDEIEKLKTESPSMKWKALVGYSPRTGPDSQFRGNHGELLYSVMEELKKYGVFLVDNGTLESWAPDLEDKVRFPETAPEYLRNKPDLKLKVVSFLDNISDFFMKE